MGLSRWFIATTVAAALLVPSGAAAVTLDQDVFDACQDVESLYGTATTKADVRLLADELTDLDDKTARKKIAVRLRAAPTAKAREKALQRAYDWCDDEAGAYARTDLSLAVPSIVEIADADTATITGTASPGAVITASVTVLGATRTTDATADENGAFAVVVPGLPLGETRASISALAPLRIPSSTFIVTIRRVESEGAYKASAREVDPDELKKDPAGLRGTRIYARGEVFQYDSATGLSAMLVSVRLVNPGRFEFWTDNVLVRLDPALGAGIDEDDIVEFWGEIQGAYSYSTRIGGTNTVPEIRAKYVALLEKH